MNTSLSFLKDENQLIPCSIKLVRNENQSMAKSDAYISVPGSVKL